MTTVAAIGLDLDTRNSQSGISVLSPDISVDLGAARFGQTKFGHSAQSIRDVSISISVVAERAHPYKPQLNPEVRHTGGEACGLPATPPFKMHLCRFATIKCPDYRANIDIAGIVGPVMGVFPWWPRLGGLWPGPLKLFCWRPSAWRVTDPYLASGRATSSALLRPLLT